MSERIPARLEVAALMRRIAASGGFATVLHRGDPERGTISLLVAERGMPEALIERRPGADFAYRWTVTAAGEALAGAGSRDWVAKASRIDPDCWLIELDIADAQRFIAETIATG